MYYTYIIYSKTADRYYIGMSATPEDRLKKHRNKSKGFTNIAQDWETVFLKEFDSKVEALSFERTIKSWKSKQKIKELVDQHNLISKE